MTNQDIVLNIAVNLGRLGRYASQNQPTRVSQFLLDTQNYLDQLENFHPRFQDTYLHFLKAYAYLKSHPPDNDTWSDTAFTWASILTHRAKFADLLAGSSRTKKASKSVVDELYGSLKTNIPYEDINTVRQKAGEIYGRKFDIHGKKDKTGNF